MRLRRPIDHWRSVQIDQTAFMHNLQHWVQVCCDSALTCPFVLSLVTIYCSNCRQTWCPMFMPSLRHTLTLAVNQLQLNPATLLSYLHTSLQTYTTPPPSLSSYTPTMCHQTSPCQSNMTPVGCQKLLRTPLYQYIRGLCFSSRAMCHRQLFLLRF